ncbi:hypothetical protein MMC32_003129 [Xylographa parallela]|nr:hypothetical protein [Xylographa parallela]
MYMSRAIAVAILAFVVGIQAKPFNYNDAAIIERSAQPDAYAEAYAYAEAEAYADAELEARALHAGDFVKGAVAAVAANKVANHYGQGTSSLNAALLGGGANVAAHSQHVQDTVHSVFSRDAEAEAEAYADAELEARALHAGDFVKGAVAAVAANKVANHYGQGTSSLNAALLGGGANVAAHSEHVQAAGQHIADAVHRLVQRDNEAMLYRRALQRRSDLWNAAGY